MNTFLGFLSIGISTYLGFTLSKKFTNRKTFYNDFNCFNKRLLTEVMFTGNTIPTILSDKNLNGDFYEYLFKTFDKKQNLVIKYLNVNENNYLKNYVEKIGTTDRKTQYEFLKSVEKVLEEKSVLSLNEEKKYKNLYIKMGFLIGIVIMVILL